VFQKNHHHPEGFSGALYLSSFGQIILKENTTISFLNNSGKSVLISLYSSGMNSNPHYEVLSPKLLRPPDFGVATSTPLHYEHLTGEKS
jgi:hypothetical protein